MRISRSLRSTVAVVAAVTPIAIPTASPAAGAPQAIVALVDSGINPYSPAFRDRSALAYRHPSTYIQGYPKAAKALNLTLDKSFGASLARDSKVWSSVKRGTLYWVPGTRIVGAISFRAGGTNCPFVEAPPAGVASKDLVNAIANFAADQDLSGTAPHNPAGECREHTILDDHGHGTMTASRAAGSPSSLAPTARIVEVEGLGGDALRWVANQRWVDVASNSWLDLIPPPVNGLVPDDSDQPPEEQFFGASTQRAFGYAARRLFTIAASGNGSAYIMGAAPTPTYALSTAAPGVVLVGGHDNGRVALWSGAPPHVVADAYAGRAAIAKENVAMRPDPIACCTSAAAPYAAGGATAIILEARRILGSAGTGVRSGIVARGRKGIVKRGPLADGIFTLEELRRVFLHTAEARLAQGRDDGWLHWSGEPRQPDQTQFGPGANPFCQGCTTTPLRWVDVPPDIDPYQFVGYGAINERSLALARKVLSGRVAEPSRVAQDQQYNRDQALRNELFSPSTDLFASPPPTPRVEHQPYVTGGAQLVGVAGVRWGSATVAVGGTFFDLSPADRFVSFSVDDLAYPRIPVAWSFVSSFPSGSEVRSSGTACDGASMIRVPPRLFPPGAAEAMTFYVVPWTSPVDPPAGCQEAMGTAGVVVASFS